MTSRLAIVGRMAMRCNTRAESDVYECFVCDCTAASCHFVKVITCTCCDKLIRTGFLVNDMDLSEYFQSATLRSLCVSDC